MLKVAVRDLGDHRALLEKQFSMMFESELKQSLRELLQSGEEIRLGLELDGDLFWVLETESRLVYAPFGALIFLVRDLRPTALRSYAGELKREMVTIQAILLGSDYEEPKPAPKIEMIRASGNSVEIKSR